MRRLGKLDNGIALPDGGYFGSLTVHHQLHCIVSDTSRFLRTYTLMHRI